MSTLGINTRATPIYSSTTSRIGTRAGKRAGGRAGIRRAGGRVKVRVGPW